MSEVKTVGVIGAGTMGHGIAQVAAQAGYDTWLYDVTAELAQKGLDRIRKNLEQGVQKGKVSQELMQQALGRLRTTGSLQDLARCELVIEAAPEELGLKQRTFDALSRVVTPDAVLATNTSSLSVGKIAQAVSRPERVVGMHFFNPVHVMKLLELVRAEQTSDATMQIARSVGERMGKTLVEVKDAPGFASTRLGIALGMEAIRMVEQGVARPEDIDRAMKVGYGHPMGPLELTDHVGLDVRLAIATYLHQELQSETFRPPRLLEQMVKEGRLGKKTGQGFYSY